MYYQQVEDNGNTRSLISEWYGYNHNLRIDRGEFYDMENMCSDYFPLLSPRPIRPLLYKTEGGNKIRGLLYSDNNIAYLVGTTLHTTLSYSVTSFDLSEYMEECEDWQTLLRFGAYILIFPVGVYINIYDPEDVGTIENTFDAEIGTKVTYTICDAEGKGYDNISASDDSPENPTDGQYWLKTSAPQGLYLWSKTQASWMPVATSYIRIAIDGAGFTDYFAEGESVIMNTQLESVNNGSVIQKITDDYIVVIGFMDSAYKEYQNTESWSLRLKRKIPHLDYVCTDKNRVWGCHYGYEDGKMVNEIYASKLGDFKSWYVYSGIATDSYSVSVGVTGEWTGCISYQGHPTFFKENAIFKIYGSFPAEYQMIQTDQRGVQQGSYRSLSIVNEYLVYKSTTDICVYDGSRPVSISEELGRDQLYYDAVGGGCLDKYRVVMEDARGKRFYFVYDFKHSLWTKEDSIPLMQISATENGQLYAATEHEIYGLGNTDNLAFAYKLVGEEWVDWYAETGDMGYEYADFKYVSRITVRANVKHRSECEVMISYDDRPFESVGMIRGVDSPETQSLAFAPFRCDHFKIKFRGHGDCKIYTVAITLDTGSEEDGL